MGLGMTAPDPFFISLLNLGPSQTFRSAAAGGGHRPFGPLSLRLTALDRRASAFYVNAPYGCAGWPRPSGLRAPRNIAPARGCWEPAAVRPEAWNERCLH